jgi:thiamine-phosphate pyrophosphorylase
VTASRDEAGRAALPRLHLVTDDDLLARPSFPEVASILLAAGGPRVALHLRSRSLAGGALYRLGERLAGLASMAGALLLVNDRLDVALACGAGGVQLGSASFPVPSARALLGADRWIGVSVHDLSEAEKAVDEGADFLVAGTLYGTASHPDRVPSGPEWIRAAVELGRPVIGIGGITPARARAVIAQGAHGVAVIRAVWTAAEPVAALKEFISAMAQEDDR